MARQRREGKYPFNDWSGPLEGYDQFVESVAEKACQKFGVDQDGDCPVNMTFVDRTKFESLQYVPVPYSHKAKTEEEWDEILRAVSLNLTMATHDMDRTLAFLRHDRLRRRAAK
jgi:predicted Co/Zn/Cd cation transporter (cation efflux family)